MPYCLLFLLSICFATPVIHQDADREHAAAFWKNSVRKQQGKLTDSQTEHVIVYGTADAKLMESIGKAAERAVVHAQKSVGYDNEPVKRQNQRMSDRPYHWDGKMIIIVCKERHEFNDVFNKLTHSKPDGNEASLYHHEQNRTYILLGPSSPPRKLNYEIMAVELAGAATLTRRHDPVPRWFANAYGHMLANKFDPKSFATERSKVPYWAAERHVRDLMMDENPAVTAGALLPLQTSLIECLSQSSTYKDDWFKVLDEMAYRNGNLAAALEEHKHKIESLQIAWKDSLWKPQGTREK